MLASGKRKVDLARALNVSPPLVDRLISMRHKSRIDQIETAMAALDKRLTVDAVTISVYLPRRDADRNQERLPRQINHVGLNHRHQCWTAACSG